MENIETICFRMANTFALVRLMLISGAADPTMISLFQHDFFQNVHYKTRPAQWIGNIDLQYSDGGVGIKMGSRESTSV